MREWFFESPSQKCFVPSLVDIGQLNLENLCYYPLGKGCGSSFEQTWIPFTQGCFEPSLVEIGQLVLARKIFQISSVYSFFSVIISPWAFSSGELNYDVKPILAVQHLVSGPLTCLSNCSIFCLLVNILLFFQTK